MPGEHDQPTVPPQQQLQHFSKVLQIDVSRPGVNANQPRGEQHLDEKHEKVLHAPPRQLLHLAVAKLRHPPLEVMDRPLPVFLIEAIHSIAQHPRQLQIDIDGPAMHQHRSDAQADVLKPVDQVIAGPCHSRRHSRGINSR
jgi:hypothetical protein